MTSQYCKQTPNLFAQLGYDEVEIEKRLDAIYEAIFYGSEEERLVHAYGEDMAYYIDGTIIDESALHPVAIIATNAMGSLATT